MTLCFHCGEPLRGSTLVARIEQRDEPVCCSGCQAVAELIAGTGLGDFYRYRDGSFRSAHRAATRAISGACTPIRSSLLNTRGPTRNKRR